MTLASSLVARIVALFLAFAVSAPAMADAQSIADECIARIANQAESGQAVIANIGENAISRIGSLDAENARPSRMVATAQAGQKAITRAAERTRQAIRNEARRCVYALVRQDADQAIIDSVVDAAQAARQSVTDSAQAGHLLMNEALQAALADEGNPA